LPKRYFRIITACLTLVAALAFSGCSEGGSLNGGSLNGTGSNGGGASLDISGDDKQACENYSAIFDSVGEAIAFDGSNAMEYAAAIDQEVLPYASSELAHWLGLMSGSLKHLVGASLIEQANYAQEVLAYGGEVAAICVPAVLND
jgi:hypothetical protein